MMIDKGSSIPFDKNVINWMEIYFSKECNIMPTTGVLYLSDKLTCREV